jgi:hypothetical protein
MGRNLLARLLVWVALAAYSLTAALPGGGVVLCLESDGHVTIEVVGAGCTPCCSSELDDAGSGARVESCPCTDVTLAAAQISVPKTKVSETPDLATGALACVSVATVDAHAAKNCRAIAPGVQRSSAVELVRSVVLRV